VFALAAFLITLPIFSLSQITSGTIIVLGYSKHKVVIAADSRMVDGAKHHDDVCKIAALNNKFIFLPTGRIIDITKGVEGWEATREARTVLSATLQRNNGHNPPNLVLLVGSQWADIMQQNISSHIRPSELASLIPNQTYVDGTFIGLTEEGDIQIAYERLRYRSQVKAILREPGGMGLVPDGMVYTALGGHTPLFNEFWQRTTKRAQIEGRRTDREAKKWNKRDADALLAVRLAGLVIKYSTDKDVAGPVDAAELQTNGTMRWIYRKKTCLTD
jgi:hypothetical protein